MALSVYDNLTRQRSYSNQLLGNKIVAFCVSFDVDK